MITQKENLILQSYMTVSLLAELGNNKFFESEYFSEMSFGSPDIKKFLQANGIDNQGCAIMSLYAMLVVPYELIRTKFPDEFSSMNDFLKNKVKIVNTSYHTNPSESDLMYHIRNSVAHCRISFTEGKSIVFTDSNRNQTKEFTGELLLSDLGMFIHNLQLVIQVEVIKDIQSRQ